MSCMYICNELMKEELDSTRCKQKESNFSLSHAWHFKSIVLKLVVTSGERDRGRSKIKVGG